MVEASLTSATASVAARAVRRRGQVYVALAALAWSTAGVLQRELSVSTATQVAGRALVAAVTLLAFVWLSNRRDTPGVFMSIGLAELAVAACTAVASASFIVALNHTTVANVLFMQAVAPIAAALIAWSALHESVSRRTGVAMVVALAGVALMVGGPGNAPGLGLALSVVMTFAFALSVVITRHRRDISMGPAICLSQLLVLAAFAPFAKPGAAGSQRPPADPDPRRRPDGARPRLPYDRRPTDPSSRGRSDHLARSRPWPPLGVARALRTAGAGDPTRRQRRHRRGRPSNRRHAYRASTR